MLNTWDVHQRAKQTKIGTEWRNLSSKTKVSLSVQVLTHWEFLLGQFRVFCKTIRTWWIATKFMIHLLSEKLHLCLNSWLKTKCLSPHTLPTHHIYCCVISFFSPPQHSRWCTRKEVQANHRMHWLSFKNRTSLNSSNDGVINELTVSSPKETILQGTVLITR